MLTHRKLGLDEALITVNKTSVYESLDVYYKLEECFGCAMDKLVSLAGKVDHFVLGTKHKLQVELRTVGVFPNGSDHHSSSQSVACSFPDLSLNNHAHYKIDVTKSRLSTYDCSLQTLDKGDCNLCPPAILLCLVLTLAACERLYIKFRARKAARNDKQPPATGVTQHSDGGEAAMDEASPETQDTRAESGGATLQDDAVSTVRVSRRSTRLDSLDAFRGLTIAGMILVNYGGAGYTQLEHAAWDGITLADFVFPFFIFSMGASIALSSHSMVKSGKTLGAIARKVIRRSLVLLIIGLCLNSKWLQGASLSHLRLTGVLQRFAVSYLIVAAMYSVELSLRKWARAQSLYRLPLLSSVAGVLFELLVAFNYLAIYLYVTFYIEYSPTCPAGYLGPGGQTEGGRFANCTGGAAAWLDQLVLGESHLYNDRELKHIFKTQHTHDPEGLLGFTTSILLTLAGLQCGKALTQSKSHKKRLLVFGQWIILLTLGCITAVEIPINKRLWSLSFVALTGAVAFVVMSLLYILFDVYSCKRPLLARLLLAAGKNSIFLYVAHSLVSDMLPWYFTVDDSSHLQLLLRLSWATFMWLLVANYMATNKLFVKV